MPGLAELQCSHVALVDSTHFVQQCTAATKPTSVQYLRDFLQPLLVTQAATRLETSPASSLQDTGACQHGIQHNLQDSKSRQSMDRVAHSQYYRQHLSGLTPQQRHQQLVSQALQQQQPGGQHGMSALHATETDYDALRKHHRCAGVLLSVPV